MWINANAVSFQFENYIKSESRGKATSIQALGNGIGEFIAMTVLLTIQMNMSVSTGVFLVGLIVLVMSLSVIMMIREPVLKKNKQFHLICFFLLY